MPARSASAAARSSFARRAIASRQGIKVVFQEIALISEFTVAENIFLEGYPTGRGGSIDWRKIRADSAALFKRIGFNVDPAAPHRLAAGQPAADGRDRAGAGARGAHRRHGRADLLADAERGGAAVRRHPPADRARHRRPLCQPQARRGVRDRRHGHRAARRPPHLDQADRRAHQRHPDPGHDRPAHRESVPALSAAPPATRWRCRSRACRPTPSCKDVSFEARAGEVLGFFGLMGAGRTELAKAIVGFDPISAGTIADRRAAACAARHARPASGSGIGLLTEDRKNEGLMLELPVYQNTSLASLESFRTRRLRRRRQGAKRACRASSIASASRRRASTSRSSSSPAATSRRCCLARWLMRGLKVIVVDEPTRGIDVGAKSEIFALIDRLAGEGLAVVMMTSEMPELLGLSDRIAVMAEGRITAMMSRDEATPGEDPQCRNRLRLIRMSRPAPPVRAAPTYAAARCSAATRAGAADLPAPRHRLLLVRLADTSSPRAT